MKSRLIGLLCPFYRYVILDEVETLRDELFRKWKALSIFGRIYVAREGINTQMSVPEKNLETFRKQLYSDKRFKICHSKSLWKTTENLFTNSP